MINYFSKNDLTYLLSLLKTEFGKKLDTSDVFEHPTGKTKASGFYKITVDDNGHVTGATAVTKEDIETLSPAYEHPEALGEENAKATAGFYKVSVNKYGHVTGLVAVTKEDITALAPEYVHPETLDAAQNNSALYKIKVNKAGHITEMTAATQEDIEALSPAYVHPEVLGAANAQGTAGFYKVAVNKDGHVTGLTAVALTDLTTLGALSEIPFSTSIADDATSDVKAATPHAVKAYVDGKISSTYKPAGTISFADRPTPTADLLGNVYNVSDAFVIDNKFMEYADGTSKSYPAGTNIVVVKDGEAYKYDVLAGFVDLSGYTPTSEIQQLGNAEIAGVWNSVFTDSQVTVPQA